MNSLWCQMLPDAKVYNLVATGFDHSPLFLNVIKKVYSVRNVSGLRTLGCVNLDVKVLYKLVET